nr:hypothetical protein [Desulfobacteraceae bacterium]
FFVETHDNYIKNYSLPSTMKMIFAAKNLTVSIESFNEALTNVKNNIQLIDHDHVDQNSETLSVYFASYTDFVDSIIKLNALKTIYEELSCLFDISLSESPIHLIKIESGSLWVKIAGCIKIILPLKELIRSFILYIFRNYTDEGKLLTLPKKMDVIERAIHLTEVLEKHGIDCSIPKENIEKSAIKVSEQLNYLIGGQPKIMLDGDELSLSKSRQDKFIEESKTLMIESKS